MLPKKISGEQRKSITRYVKFEAEAEIIKNSVEKIDKSYVKSKYYHVKQ